MGTGPHQVLPTTLTLFQPEGQIICQPYTDVPTKFWKPHTRLYSLYVCLLPGNVTCHKSHSLIGLSASSSCLTHDGAAPQPSPAVAAATTAADRLSLRSLLVHFVTKAFAKMSSNGELNSCAAVQRPGRSKTTELTAPRPLKCCWMPESRLLFFSLSNVLTRGADKNFRQERPQ